MRSLKLICSPRQCEKNLMLSPTVNLGFRMFVQFCICPMHFHLVSQQLCLWICLGVAVWSSQSHRHTHMVRVHGSDCLTSSSVTTIWRQSLSHMVTTTTAIPTATRAQEFKIHSNLGLNTEPLTDTDLHIQNGFVLSQIMAK